VRLGQRIICPNCGVQLEVISTHPIEVDIAYDDSEEWDDLDGYGVDDEEDVEDLDELVRLEGKSGDLLDELDGFSDDLDDDFEDDFEDDELDEELDDELDEEDDALFNR
jgi:lysine biosynthesis protein LysW